MSPVVFIQYESCSTCRKARAWLDSRGVAYVSRPIKEERPAAEELKKWRSCPVCLKKFFNTSGLLYKSLHLKDRLPAMTEEEQLELLASDGMLVKRPLGYRGGFRSGRL